MKPFRSIASFATTAAISFGVLLIFRLAFPRARGGSGGCNPLEV